MNKLKLLFAGTLLMNIPSIYAFGFTVKNLSTIPIYGETKNESGRTTATFMLQPARAKGAAAPAKESVYNSYVSCPATFDFTAYKGDEQKMKRITYTNPDKKCLTGSHYTLEINWDEKTRKFTVNRTK